MAGALGAPVTSVRRLPGASTSAVHLLRLSDGRRAVLRRYVWSGFLAEYQSITGETMDPYWEIASVLEHSPASWTPERVARSERRLAAAVAAYG